MTTSLLSLTCSFVAVPGLQQTQESFGRCLLLEELMQFSASFSTRSWVRKLRPARNIIIGPQWCSGKIIVGLHQFFTVVYYTRSDVYAVQRTIIIIKSRLWRKCEVLGSCASCVCCLRRTFEPKKEEVAGGWRICIMRSFITCTLH
jgi:hypothetical protein